MLLIKKKTYLKNSKIKWWSKIWKVLDGKQRNRNDGQCLLKKMFDYIQLFSNKLFYILFLQIIVIHPTLSVHICRDLRLCSLPAINIHLASTFWFDNLQTRMAKLLDTTWLDQNRFDKFLFIFLHIKNPPRFGHRHDSTWTGLMSFFFFWFFAYKTLLGF